MTKPIEEYKKIVAEIEQKKGVKVATAKIVAEIFATPEEISIEELANKTKYSLATISNNVSFLEQIGVISRIKKPGSKRIYVTAERDFINILIKSMNKNHEIAVRPLKQILPGLIAEQKKLVKHAQESNRKKQLKEELNIIQQHYEQVRIMEQLLDHVISQCNKNRNLL
ncbi:HTH domain-containing protein [Candidatus Woesearchaeota archaeon]|nr:HTH domain-containing protein [Candidatus Woesearchaeota archaeon]